MNLVVGATGLVGSEVCERLRQAGKPVRALVRPTANAAKVEELARRGVERVQGDITDHRSLDAACAGAAVVVSTASSTSRQGESLQAVDLDGQIALIDAARAADVRRFVFVSFRPKPDLDYPLQSFKVAVENHLRASGMVYTILRATPFMEIWLSPHLGFDAAGGQVRIYGAGENGISWVSYHDVAAYCAAVLDNPAAENATIDIGGPEALSPKEVVRIFEEESGRKFAMEHVPEAALHQQYEAAQDPTQKSFAGLMLHYAGGDAVDMTETSRRLGVPLTSVRDYARQALRGVATA